MDQTEPDSEDRPTRSEIREEAARQVARARTRSRPEPDEDPIALDDVRLSRKDGELEPLKRRSMLNGHTVVFRPVSYGAKVRHDLYDRDVMALTDEEKLELLREFYLAPDFEGVEVEEMRREFDWLFVDDLCLTLVKESRSRFRAGLPDVQERESGKEEVGEGKATA